MNKVNILLSSAGRRPYLVKWFQEALRRNGVSGDVILADADPTAASRAYADKSLTAPPVGAAGYFSWLSATISQNHVDLAISVNDFEISEWSRRRVGTTALLSLDAQAQNVVEDKHAMARHLRTYDIRVPETQIAASTRGTDLLARSRSDVVVKARYGSGSRGLEIASGDNIDAALARVSSAALDRTGQQSVDVSKRMEYVVLQPRIGGQEFGLDVVHDFRGAFAAALVRKKLSMRGGETDKAVTVDARPFRDLAQRIGESIPHRGLIDVDVIQDEHGRLWVIDINPRFGGGYPFSHAAGADVPSAYIAWMTNQQPEPSWLTYRVGVTSAKHVELATLPASV